ncbi:L-aspartate oxidase [Haliangium ochraceum]|uniref:L-aspartate oxidase n=1 Tax=Haliangium ochraceum (strain DSM 14365 / JCM 11303 / SMP-2) TaxID=502025 RepID=D0LPX0_HALO1|nr:L-aspartate oxidase [Haliangium ochraceum]ACY17007.1 L-aspartate oxidase [Haliangium ochraceum DSM 14365]
MTIEVDYLVIGSGIAGLSFALRAAEHGSVLVATKKRPDDTATNWAQGGIAAVLGEDDSFEAHIQDTLRVGDGLCQADTVELVVREGPDHVRELVELGVDFARSQDGKLDLTREGGHTKRRVAHYKDITGREVQRALLAKVATNPRITMWDDHIAVDLLSMAKYGGEPACFGAYVLDNKSGEVKTVIARATVLATGGAGKVYIYTSNPDVATGDGIAMAYRIGAQVANLEFMQFHPTVLYHPHAKSFLISEALRGEGGILRRADGVAFMDKYHPLGSLGPRDVVARAIDNEIKSSGADSVFLDMTHLDPGFVRERFPTIDARCAALGIDITREPIPVVPAAHYMCGGVVTNGHGETTVRNLYAIGETACTGLHGACRLASNSLLEGVVLANRAAAAVARSEALRPANVIPWSSGTATDSDDAIVVTLNWDEIRRFMWSYLGIVRSEKRIERARRRIELLRQEIAEYYWNFKVTSDIVELRNLALVAHLIIESARRRRESRGLHYMLDFPDKAESARDTTLHLTNGPPP